jgi:SAM-dependent methyltransferase
MAISAIFETGNLSIITQFDAVFSFSSFEHAGLGRYGDPLNPYGDFEAVAQVSCLLKPGGIFFLGFGIGQDKIEWNAHRIYGKIRLPFVTANFRLLDIVGDFEWGKAAWNKQPIMVLQNTFGCSDEHRACERPVDIPSVSVEYMRKRKNKPPRRHVTSRGM